MMKKTDFKGIRGLQMLKAAPLALLLLQGNQLLAESTTSPKQAAEGFSLTEGLLYAAAIAALVFLTWLFGSWQSKHSSGNHHAPPKHHRHFEHPNDPHFRKLKKKTS